MPSTAVWICVLGVVVPLVGVLVGRSGILYRWPRFLRWRRAKSRRDRGRVRAGGPSDGGGVDHTAGASF
ncbi:hypothetical protein [Nocardioides sp. 1609]|uniref:hypothetical protein n=1 Tax=Nocardioides sp. 1609 TaxID=2508327 RepID=UPI00106FF938|nr:hypothetical protein [Nocardioides sp. 1609]